MELFKPAWKSNDETKAIKAVAEISDQQKLAKIAKEAPYWKTRIAALKKIDPLQHQSLLFDLIKNDAIYQVRDIARSLSEKAQQMAQRNLISTRVALIEKSTDQMFLANVAKSDEDSSICIAAAKKLTDQTLLFDVAKSAKYYRDVRNIAVGKLDSQQLQALLADIAKNYKDFYLCSAAIEKLTDQTTLADIAKNHKDFYLCSAAIEKLTDQTTLADIAKNHKDTSVRSVAIKKLTDQITLAEIAKTDEEVVCQIKAAIKITNPITLAVVLQKIDFYNFHTESMKNLVERITNDILLREIAINCKSDFLRNYCCEKLGGHLLDGCKCSICGIEKHEYREIAGGGNSENAGGFAETFDIFYRCLRCGKTKIGTGFRYTDW